MYSIQANDFIAKIVNKNYPVSSRINSKEQIMVAILRANPKAFKGGNINFLKSVDSLILPSEDVISSIPKSEAISTIQDHYKFFKQKKTGNFPNIPLKRPVLKTSATTNLIAIEEKSGTKKVSTAPQLIDNIYNENESFPKDGFIYAKKSVNTTADIQESFDDFANSNSNAKSTKMLQLTQAQNLPALAKETKDSTITESEDADVDTQAHDLSHAVDLQEKVIVYNWSDYIPEGVLEEFTKETGIRVEYFTYNNNQIMYEKLKLLKGRGYDVLVPSSDLVERMRNEGMIRPIDHRKLTNFKQLDPNLLDKPYDPENKFSIPYLWGSAGIGINTEKLKGAKVASWENLWHTQWRGKLLLLDDMRNAFNVALRLNGHSINTSDPNEIKKAYEKLRKLMPNIKMLTRKPRSEFITANVDLGVLWNGEIVLSKQENPALDYIYPKEGANFWINSFVISSRSAHTDNAHKFIDFMIGKEVAARCVAELGYASPNLEAMNLLDEKIRNNSAIFPKPEVLNKAEFQQDVGNSMKLYLLYWEKLKAGG